MATLSSLFGTINGFVWGWPMLILILGVGFFMSLGLKFMPILRIGSSLKLLAAGVHTQKGDERDGEVSPFQALMTAMAATVGTGNIAGVATAVFLGGPGALFWMWVTALVGMATKYSEAVLAVRFREVDEEGNHVGGPMYYLKNGLGRRWAWLGTAFAIFGAIAGFGIGNTVQSNSIAQVFEVNFGIPSLVTSLVAMVLVGAVLVGGIRRIGAVAGKLVPFMAVAYILAGLVVLSINVDQIGPAMSLIFHSAFSGHAAQGGFAGAAVWAAIRFGVARGVFSNEAGLGSAPIAHAAAQTRDPVRQGLIAMLGTLLDTLIVCTITGLVIVSSGAWDSGESGAALTSAAFASALPGVGNYVVAISLAIFAFSTILGWSFYGERCVEFLFGVKAIKPFRVLWILAVPLGAVLSLNFVWLVADTLNALMALPNLIAIAALSPVVFKLTRDYFDRQKAAVAVES